MSNQYNRFVSIRAKYILEFYGTVGIPLIYIIGLYLISLSGTAPFTTSARSLALVGVGAGIATWIASYISLSRSFGVLPKRQLRVKKGIYRLFHHPMYIGIVLTYLSLSIANQSQAGLYFTLAILTPILIVRALLEDRLLYEKR